MSKNITFFCKDSDTVIYDAIDADNPSSFQQERLSKWLETAGNTSITQAMEDGCCGTAYLVRDDNTIVFDETAYVSDKKDSLKTDLATYRWNINRGSVDNLLSISYCGAYAIGSDDDSRLRLDQSANAAIRKTYQPTDTFRFKGMDGNWYDVLIEDMVDWPIMLVETEQVFFEKEEEVEIAIDLLTTKTDVDGFNVVTELDELVKPVLSADLATYAYPVKYYNEDNA